MVATTKEVIREHLDINEKLFWSGQPRQGIVLRSIDFLLIPFSILWGGFAFFWEFSVLTMGVQNAGGAAVAFVLVGLVFSLVGLYLIVGRFLADRYYRRHLYYGLTDKRIIIVSDASRRSITSYDIDTLSGLRLVERSSDRGTIHLTDVGGGFFGNMNGFQPWHAALGNNNLLFEIDRPKEIMGLLRDHRNKT